MSKVRNFAEIAPGIPFSEFDFYDLYRSTFEKSELGRIKSLLLNGSIHYQIFCDVIIDPTRPLTNYKLLDDIMLELAGKLKIQQLQDILAEKWKPYMQNLDTLYTDATCYESEMRYPTDAKLLWEGIEKSYETMCELSKRLGIHRPRTKFIDVQKANLTYKKQRKYSKSQTRKMTRRLLELLGKILKEIRELERTHKNAGSLLTSREKGDLEIITRMYRQQKNHFRSGNCKENGIQTSFVKRGRPSSEEKKVKDLVRQELARVRATRMEGSFGTQKEHYDLKRVKARTKLTEILYIFFGIHTANVVQLADRMEQRAQLAAA